MSTASIEKKVTKGPWIVDHGAVISPSGQYVARHGFESEHLGEADGNAALIAEAGTVYHETGFTPRQLAERVRGEEILRNAALAAKNLIADERDALQRERDELREALGEFGSHRYDCAAVRNCHGISFNDDCTCGFGAALAKSVTP